MSKFALKEYNNVTGKIKFFKLIEDKFCYWDDFCREIQKDSNMGDQLVTIISGMNDIANLRMLPNKNLRILCRIKKRLKNMKLKLNI